MCGVEAREDLDLAPGELGDPADGGEVAVLVLKDEQVHRNLLARAVQCQLLVEVGAGIQEGGILLRRAGVLPGLDSARADVGQRGLDHSDAAPRVVDHLVRGLERGAEAALCVRGPIEQLRQVCQHVRYLLLAIVKVGEKVRGGGEKHVVNIADHQLGGLAVALDYLVELERAMIGDEANLGAAITGELVQLLGQCITKVSKISSLQRAP